MTERKRINPSDIAELQDRDRNLSADERIRRHFDNEPVPEHMRRAGKVAVDEETGGMVMQQHAEDATPLTEDETVRFKDYVVTRKPQDSFRTSAKEVEGLPLLACALHWIPVEELRAHGGLDTLVGDIEKNGVNGINVVAMFTETGAPDTPYADLPPGLETRIAATYVRDAATEEFDRLKGTIQMYEMVWMLRNGGFSGGVDGDEGEGWKE